MLREISVDFLVSRFHLVLQLIDGILLRHCTRVLQQHLQTNLGLLVETLINRLLLGDDKSGPVAASACSSARVEFPVRQTADLWLFASAMSLIKLVLINWLFEKFVDFGVRDIGGGILALLLKIILSDDAGFLKLELALHVGSVANAMRFRLFSHSQQTSEPPAQNPFAPVSSVAKPGTHLRRLIFGNQCHVFCRQFDRAGFRGFDLPVNQTEGKNYGDRGRDKSFSCRSQNTFLS